MAIFLRKRFAIALPLSDRLASAYRFFATSGVRQQCRMLSETVLGGKSPDAVSTVQTGRGQQIARSLDINPAQDETWSF